MTESWASSETARRVMRGNKSRDTKPELAVRKLVHGRGLRYRVDARAEADLRRSVDLLFTRARVAIFIDGCYWHGCPVHFVPSKSNVEFWAGKIDANRKRDLETTEILESRGWVVLRFWEHEGAEGVAERIETAVRERAASKT